MPWQWSGTSPFERVGIIGETEPAVTLAVLALARGMEVVMAAPPELLGAVLDRLERRRLRGLVESDRASEALFRIRFEPLVEALDCDLVIEATHDDLHAKRMLLGSIDSAVAPETMVVVITALWDLEVLGKECARGGRLVRAYLPVPEEEIDLVEVAVRAGSDDGTLGTACEWFASLGRKVFICEDRPGLHAVRVEVVEALEAMRLVGQGAMVEEVDQAVMMCRGLPMGPLRRSDLVGLDVRLRQARSLQVLGPRFDPPEILIEMVESGQHGRSTGSGFYAW